MFKFGKKKNEAEAAEKIVQKETAQPVETAQAVSVDQNELVAVITAAVMACLGAQSNLVVRSITRVGDNSPVWARAGRSEQMANRF